MSRSFRVAVNSLLVLLSVGALGTVRSSCASADSVIIFGDLTDQAISSYGRFHRAATDVEAFLTAIDFNRPATSTANYFAVSVGGVNAIQDLEDGRGVDPGTLGALYAGYALPEVARHLNLKYQQGGKITIDAPDGRLRYKGTVVRMYSPSRLRRLYQIRKTIFEEDERKRSRAITRFITERLAALNSSDSTAAKERVRNLDDRYQILRDAISEVEQELRTETDLSSILPPAMDHLFNYSVGGLNIRLLLDEHQMVDPATLAAIYASEIEPDDVADISIDPRGLVFYKGRRVRMLSIVDLQHCYRRREALELQSKTR